MNDEHRKIIDSLQSHIQQLKSLYETEKQKVNELQVELDRQRIEVMYAHKKLLELQARHDNLTMSQSLSVNEEERKKAQQRLTNMVREINKCLALLNQ